MAKTSYICTPGSDLVTLGTPSWTGGDITDYEASKVQNYRPDDVTQGNSTTDTLRITHSGSQTPRLLGVINHDWVGRTVSFQSSAGTITSLTIPSRTNDGQCTNIFLDLNGLSNVAGTYHQFVFSGGSGGPKVGRICLIPAAAITTIRWVVGRQGNVEYNIEWAQSVEQSYFLIDLTYDKGIRLRRAKGVSRRLAQYTELKAILESAKGANIPFLFVPDASVNDCWYAKVDAPSLTTQQQTSAGKIMVTPLGIVELSMGLPL